MSKINAHPDHLRRSGSKLSDFGGKLAEGGQKLETAGQNLVSHASSDRSGVGAVVAKAMGRGVQITGKVFSEGGRVVEGAGKRLGTTADLYEEADGQGTSRLRRLHPDAKGDIDPMGGGSRAGSRVGGSRGSERSARQQVGEDTRPGGIPKVKKCTGGDPVDLVTGDVLMTQLDLALPGVLALLLSRTHQSSYRAGRLFGPSWASTLDQRLEIDAEGVVFVGEDGLLLAFPTPDADPVLPADGPRWPLRRARDGYVLADLDAGRELAFAADGSLTWIGDRIGHRVEFDRDASSSPTRLRHSGGYVVDVVTADGLVVGLSAGGAPVARYGYDEDRNLVEVADPEGRSYRFDYDAAGRLTQWTDRNGHSYRYRYDATGRCVAGEGDDGLLNATFDYGDTVTTMTNSLGQATTYHFNDALQVVKIVDPLGGETVSEWDAYDRLLARTDPLGRTTRYEYTVTGYLHRLTRPDGTQTVAVYGENRLPDIVVEPDGAQWRRAFDHNGNTIAVTDPTGTMTRLDYDEHGHIAAVTDPTGATTRFECDAAGQILAVTDPLGAVTRYERNDLGQVVAVTDALGGLTRFSWTVDGRPTERVLPDGTVERWTYDGEGNETSYTNGIGQTVTTEYGGFDLPLAGTEPGGARTAYAYDTELRLTTVTDPAGLVWRYEHDAAGNIVGETDVNGRHQAYTRDAAGQILTRTNVAGQITTFTHDVLGRLVRRESADAVTTFAYDPADRLIQATNQDAELTFTRDVLGQVIAETCEGRTLLSAFDAMGRKVACTTPTGAVSRWSYDPTGLATQLTAGGQTLSFGYDAAGNETTRRFGTATLTQTWDVNHRLHTQALTIAGPAGQERLVQRRAYRLRADSAVTAIVDQLAGIREFDLDLAGRVTAVTAPDHREQYAYGPNGVLTGPDRTHAGTLPRAAGASRYDHDGQGRAVARHTRTLSGQTRTWRYAWNGDDRLVAVTTPDGIAWRYRYDPLGRRIAKLRLGPDGQIAEQTVFVWDGATLVEQIHSGGQALTWDYQPGGFTPITQTERIQTPQEWVDSRFYAIVTDLIGTPHELVDPYGTVAWRQPAALWGGQLTAPAQQTQCPLRFPGQYFDPETGNNYNLFRYYDPEAASYLAPDPLGLDAGPNPNAYVPNPIGWLDPLGLAGCDDPRNQPGRATGAGDLPDVNGKWLRGSHGNAGRIPGQIARQLQGQQFNTFDDFRKAFWKAVGNDPQLSSQFSPSNVRRMQNENAPIAHSSQHVGKVKSYALHHVTPIQHGGAVYDMRNIVVVTPQFHRDVLDRGYHFG
ncbi:DUF6531 domain-containing protein [Kutzneria buriramensis]|uniref:RHS repeat-associated protein n=1 Tax=Kutzneria buriramensis TaxID=1045776 RepID=A0A3E0H1T5_9PSEU|nr:DUF6531 domain-containing protein [Kutzneria buriramensis]REH35728.1 RHS repeat-associated protein [Kutzneria buriramensis]